MGNLKSSCFTALLVLTHFSIFGYTHILFRYPLSIWVPKFYFSFAYSDFIGYPSFLFMYRVYYIPSFHLDTQIHVGTQFSFGYLNFALARMRSESYCT